MSLCTQKYYKSDTQHFQIVFIFPNFLHPILCIMYITCNCPYSLISWYDPPLSSVLISSYLYDPSSPSPPLPTHILWLPHVLHRDLQNTADKCLYTRLLTADWQNQVLTLFNICLLLLQVSCNSFQLRLYCLFVSILFLVPVYPIVFGMIFC